MNVYHMADLNIKDVLKVTLSFADFKKATGITKDRGAPNVKCMYQTGALVPDIAKSNT